MLRNGVNESLRTRLMEFTWLYKFVVGTLVKRDAPRIPTRDRVNEVYPHLTPDALREVTVRFKMPNSLTVLAHKTPMFNISHAMTSFVSLAVVLYMKYQRDAFFLWILGLFYAGVKAPNDAVTRPTTLSSGTPKRKPKMRPRQNDGTAAEGDEGGADGAAGNAIEQLGSTSEGAAGRPV